MVRLACVRFLNTSPLVEGLEKLAGVELIPAVPSRIADLVTSGQADVGLASIVDAVRCPLSILPAGMIGCDGATLTVRLFSSVEFARVEELHADTDSHTSIALARLILARRFGVRPRVVDYHARERVTPGEPAPGRSLDDWPACVLLIGDKVVTDRPPDARYPHQLDLGEAWKQMTGRPFAYAAWMCRRGEEDTDKVVWVSALLDRQRRHNAARLEWIASRRAPIARWPADVARRYLVELLRYDLTARARESAEEFLRLAHAEGLVPPGPPRFARPAGVVPAGA